MEEQKRKKEEEEDSEEARERERVKKESYKREVEEYYVEDPGLDESADEKTEQDRLEDAKKKAIMAELEDPGYQQMLQDRMLNGIETPADPDQPTHKRQRIEERLKEEFARLNAEENERIVREAAEADERERI